MSRELSEKFRLVIHGLISQPVKMTTECRVEDGDLQEPPLTVKFRNTDFSKSVKDIWNSTIDAVKKQEKL